MEIELTLNMGASTEEPALPYSKAFNSCGKILLRHIWGGKESREGVRLAKNLFFSA